MLRTIRLTLAIVFFALVTLLFLDFTGTLHGWMGWMAKIQFLPALLALNVGVVLLLVVLTLLFGRVYCSVICPLGVFQDVISRFAGKRKKNRFRYSPAKKWLRYGMLALFAVTLIAGVRFHAVASLLEPYSSYGRIASNLFAPVYQWGNNLLAYLAERADSYAFYETEVWMKSLPTFIIASLTFAVLIILAWRGGRTYCNTICPVGTVLGFLSKYSLFKPVIDTAKCNGCGLAVIEDKKIPARAAAITPPGSLSARNFAQHCTACQLCVAVCPNQVLRPSSDLTKLMQPEMSYERGYCRPECTKCSEVCPAGAIRPITKADKSAIQIGHAVWIKENCICITDDVECGNCARHCPVSAIQMVASDPGNPESKKIPVVNTERCIGCGACENLCPSRPFSAIYVEGHIMHRTV